MVLKEWPKKSTDQQFLTRFHKSVYLPRRVRVRRSRRIIDGSQRELPDDEDDVVEK